MTLVERLRARYPDDTDCMAAAAEIERLEAICADWAIRHGQLGTEMGYMRRIHMRYWKPRTTVFLWLPRKCYVTRGGHGIRWLTHVWKYETSEGLIWHEIYDKEPTCLRKCCKCLLRQLERLEQRVRNS